MPLQKRLMMGLLVLMIIFAGWAGYHYWSISYIGENSEPEPADVIIVLGAAVWPMGPSPALQARIYHSYTIYREGLADQFILTGGHGQYPPSEAEAMAKALAEMGVDQGIMLLEDQAKNTLENLTFSKAIMEQQGWETAIIVTDTFHLKRALLLARDIDLTAFGAPAKNSVLYQNKGLRVKYTLRELVALTNYYLQKWLRR